MFLFYYSRIVYVFAAQRNYRISSKSSRDKCMVITNKYWTTVARLSFNFWFNYGCKFSGQFLISNFFILYISLHRKFFLQESNWFSAHILGAMFAFGFGLLYVWGQTVIGWRMRKPLDKSPCLTPIRFTLCLLTTIFFVTSKFVLLSSFCLF